MKKERILYFDILRIIAIVAVILLHCSGQNFRGVDIHSDTWHAFNIYESISRFGVALFTMVSGALFLSGSQPISQILKKNVLRIAVAFIYWSAIYVCIFNDNWSIPTVINKLFSGTVHMWYMFAIIGLYLLVPILRVIVNNVKIAKYFLVLCFLFAYVFPQLVSVISLYSYTLGEIGKSILGNINLQFVMGLTGYYVLGYMLHHYELDKKIIRWIYAGCIFSFGLNIIGTIVISYRQNIADTLFYDNASVTTLIQAIAIFVWARQHFGKKESLTVSRHPVIEKLAICSFGVYLVHPLFLSLLDQRLGLNTLSFNAWISVPTVFIIVLVPSLAISLVLNHIPIIKKYIV